MDFRFTADEEGFRSEFIAWLEKTVPADHARKPYRMLGKAQDWARAHRDFQKALFDGGYSGMHYPKEYGGRGEKLSLEVIVLETIAQKCVELRTPGVITFGMAAPTILICGTEEQKREFLPKILDGTHIWCQGFSEPNAGSDVANVSTRAVKKNGQYIVSGQKTWTSFAHIADYCILLVRTDPGAKKHKGLSYLLMDMKSPGVEVRPIRQLTGEAEFNEVYMEDVRVPVEMRIGAEGEGWRVAITTLMFERAIGDATMAAVFLGNISRMIDMAKQVKRSGRPVIQDPLFRQHLAQAYIDVMALKYHGYRNLSQLFGGGIPGPEGSIGKLLWSESNQRICEAALLMQGALGQVMWGSPHAVQAGRWQFDYLRSKGNTIEAGTSEVQRNIIAERVLGLPKDLSRADKQQERR